MQKLLHKITRKFTERFYFKDRISSCLRFQAGCNVHDCKSGCACRHAMIVYGFKDLNHTCIFEV